MGWGRGSTRQSRATRTRILTRDPVCRCPGCPRCASFVPGAGCGRVSTDDDHVVPLTQGGSDHDSNHAGKCQPCHKHKSQQEARAGRRKHSVARIPERHPGLR